MNLSDLESDMEGRQVVFTVPTDNDKEEKEVFEQENKNKTVAVGYYQEERSSSATIQSFDQDLAAFADLTEVTQWLRLGMPLLAILIVSIVQILLFYLWSIAKIGAMSRWDCDHCFPWDEEARTGDYTSLTFFCS